MITIKNEDLPVFLNGKDIAQWTSKWQSYRRVFIYGKLTWESNQTATLELMKLDNESNEPILLMINSPGGDVIPTHQFEDTIKAMNSPVDAIVIGDCASMAVDLVQMCRKRLALPSSRMLLHYARTGQEWICDDLEQLEKDIALFRQRACATSERRMRLYVERTGMPPEKLKEIMRHGEVHRAFISAKQALELRLIDEISSDFKIFPTSKTEEKK